MCTEDSLGPRLCSRASTERHMEVVKAFSICSVSPDERSLRTWSTCRSSARTLDPAQASALDRSLPLQVRAKGTRLQMLVG